MKIKCYSGWKRFEIRIENKKTVDESKVRKLEDYMRYSNRM
jgi:hypothetical protein